MPNDQNQVELDNYYTGEKISISLDKALTPNQNAQRYFKRYQKLKEAVKHLTSLIEETRATILYLESVETALAQASLTENCGNSGGTNPDWLYPPTPKRENPEKAETGEIFGNRWPNHYPSWPQQSTK